jgi:hypothetical protein
MYTSISDYFFSLQPAEGYWLPPLIVTGFGGVALWLDMCGNTVEIPYIIFHYLDYRESMHGKPKEGI